MPMKVVCSECGVEIEIEPGVEGWQPVGDHECVPKPMVESVEEIEVLLNQLLVQIDAQIDAVQAYALGERVRPFELRTPRGDWPMIPLMTAKAQVLTGLLALERDAENG